MKIRNPLISILLFIFSLCSTPLLIAEEIEVDEIAAYSVSGWMTAAAGRPVTAVIAVEIPRDAYIYANPKGRGIGKATEISLRKNKIIKSWEVRYPEGEKYLARGDTDQVNRYTKIVRIPVTFMINDHTAAGDYSVNADLSALMCTSDACLPVERSIDIILKVKRGVLNSTPVMMNNLSEFLLLKKNISTASEDLKKGKAPDNGSMQSDDSGIPESIEFTPHYPDGEITGLVQAILFGLIAGFILNFMPCVLPVVSLKIMSFVFNAGERRKVIIIQGFLFSAGIIVSFLVLAALAAFSGHKWGGLFQDKIFIIGMASFIFAMALSLFGVYVFNIPLFAGKAVSKTRGIYTDAFIKGVVATLLATPCSGPFLGGTLAWTLTRPPEIIFIIFLSVGAGMALPYMLLALNPSLLRYIPKPGAWMNRFEKAMGFLLMFTVVYLLSILDNSGRMGMILFLLFLSIGLWQFGEFGSLDRDRWKRVVSFTMLLAVAVMGYVLSFKYFFNERVSVHERLEFSTERILKNRDIGIITVVEFTAEWCPNCSLVEKLALEKDEVQNLFARDDIEFMVADITMKNIPAESFMNRLGSKSIPMLAIMPPGEGFNSPFCLRDIYSAEDVVLNVKNAEKFIIKK
jgi:thiol:disulfide interchange protein DsbD